MRTLLRGGLYVSLLVALCVSLTSCDSGGSNGSPKWVGDWEITNADELTYWLVTEDELEIRSFSGSNPDNCVGSSTFNIVDTGSSEVTVGGEDEDQGDEENQVTITFEGSGDELTALVDGEPDRTLSAVDSVPPCN